MDTTLLCARDNTILCVMDDTKINYVNSIMNYRDDEYYDGCFGDSNFDTMDTLIEICNTKDMKLINKALAYCDYLKSILYLLEHGADVDIIKMRLNIMTKNAFYDKYGCIHEVDSGNNSEIVEALLNNGYLKACDLPGYDIIDDMEELSDEVCEYLNSLNIPMYDINLSKLIMEYVPYDKDFKYEAKYAVIGAEKNKLPDVPYIYI